MVPEDDDDASKTEEPSERKISKAKEEGDVALSQDAKSFIMLWECCLSSGCCCR